MGREPVIVTSLSEFLGPLRASFDDFVERAPDGEVEVASGETYSDIVVRYILQNGAERRRGEGDMKAVGG